MHFFPRAESPGRMRNPNPKDHVMIVTGTIGYVIVDCLVEIGHSVVLLDEFWSLCTANRTEVSLVDLLL